LKEENNNNYCEMTREGQGSIVVEEEEKEG
jgi:hypothetical protein